jgi:hypothetical protein
MARIEVVRHVAADPSSLALLLSGPTGRELWGDDSLVLSAPERSGLGFRVDVAASSPANARGRILIAAGAAGPIASEVSLTFSVVGDVPAMRHAVTRFLDALALAAHARSSAA